MSSFGRENGTGRIPVQDGIPNSRQGLNVWVKCEMGRTFLLGITKIVYGLPLILFFLGPFYIRDRMYLWKKKARALANATKEKKSPRRSRN